MSNAHRQRLRVDERRRQLLDLAIDLFSSGHYEDVSVDALARAAGVSKGLLYHYFPGKRALYVAAVREAASQLLEATDMSEEVGDRPPNLDDIRRGLSVYLEYVEAKAPAYLFVMRQGVGDAQEVARVIDETRAEFVSRVLEGMGDDKPDATLKTLLRGWVGFVEASVLEWLETRDLERDALLNLLVDVFSGIVAAYLRNVPKERQPEVMARLLGG